jgi:ABC-type multidrug transport system permease subunit
VGVVSPSRPTDAEAPRAPARRTPAGAVRALIARDYQVTRSYRTALFSDIAFGFINLVVYHYISQTLRPRVGHGLDGAPTYFAFAAVGVALSIVLQASMAGLARRVREEQLTGTLEMLLAQPISPTELALGLAGFPFLFSLARAFIYLLLAGAFLGLSLAHVSWLGLIVSFAVSGLAFAGIGIGLAALVIVFKRAEMLGSFGTVGLGLLGGAVFPASALPSWLHPLATIVPTRFAFDAVRNALFGTRGWLGPTLILLAIGAVLVVISLALFTSAVRLVVRLGSVSQY